MPKKEVNVTLATEQVDALQASLRSLADGKPPNDEQFRVLVSLAVGSWIDWLSGRKRYRSVTEQSIDWLSSIYTQILPQEEPSESRLYTHFNLPYGQAQYLARVLRDQHQGVWRTKALTALRDSLKVRVDEARQWIKESRGEERMTFLISKGSRVELSSVLGTLAQRGTPGLSPVRPEGTMGSYSYVSVAAADVVPILKEIDKVLEG